ncbi:MCM2/3/5 family-domain-containing protein [Zopfochytrium polystomum]|nr:MCM2/3/5 family-domain-containing protein [Zopfochytrium polystomum]
MGTQAPRAPVTVLQQRDEIALDLIALCEAQIVDMMAETDQSRHYAIEIDMLLYLNHNQSICNQILQKPMHFIPLMDDALQKAQQRILDTSPLAEHLSIKPFVHARCTSLGQVPEFQLSRVPRSTEVGRLICFVGTVIRTGMVKLMETRKLFDCATCGRRFSVHHDREQFNQFPKPTRCGAGGVDADGHPQCDGKKFKPLSTDTGEMPDSCKDYQEIKVQEQVTKLAIGTIPRSITVILEDDLADQCKAGDDVAVIGTVIRRWQSLILSERPGIEIVLVANHLRINNEQRASNLLIDDLQTEFLNFWQKYENNPMKARNLILQSFCPKIVGMYLVKLAVMLVLVGGVARNEAGMKVRGDGHLLLVGDPGIGKSQFLRYAARISPRAVLTTGIGSTNAGLTVAAVKDSGEWQLEAGALVLADRGLCCIDEFGSIREQDKTAIHEAMEQQTISVAKAGIVCKLNTRCSILAATNPKGKYDPTQTLEVNIALASPLLSRFDLVLTLVDGLNPSWDKQVCSFILGLNDSADGTDIPDESSMWSLDKLRSYVSFVKARCHPKLTEPANMILKRYYQVQRASDVRNAARTTVRLLESLIRLAQSHARLMCQGEVTVRDAVNAVMLMEISMCAAGFSNVQTALHKNLPKDAEEDYVQQETSILAKLGLSHLATGRYGDDDGGNDQGGKSGGVNGGAQPREDPSLSQQPPRGLAEPLAKRQSEAVADEETDEDEVPWPATERPALKDRMGAGQLPQAAPLRPPQNPTLGKSVGTTAPRANPSPFSNQSRNAINNTSSHGGGWPHAESRNSTGSSSSGSSPAGCGRII